MNYAKITSKGQLTLPVDIRKKLGVGDGDKVVFLEVDNRIVVANADTVAKRLRESPATYQVDYSIESDYLHNDLEQTLRRLRVQAAQEKLEVIKRAESAARAELERLASETDTALLKQELERLRVERVMAALKVAQESFAGEAERLGLRNEDDVVEMIREIRQQRWDEQHADHD